MNLSIRQLKTEDYNELCEWWKWFRFPAPSLDLLPDRGESGFIVYDDETKENVVAGFLYTTNSYFSMCEFIVSNPQIKDKTVREESINMLIDVISLYAKECGCKLIFTSLKHPSLKNRFVDRGYKIGSTNTTELIKIL